MARHTGGWVKLWRKASLGDINSNFTRGGLFGALISMANIQNSKVEWLGKPKELERGQIVTSLKELAELGSIDVKTVKKHLNYLRLRETLTVETSRGGLLITINNYEEYQGQDADGSEMFPEDVPDGMDDGIPNASLYNEEIKNKRNKEIKNIYACEFDSLAKEYRKTFKGTTTGAQAKARFTSQIKTLKDFQDIKKAMAHYKIFLDAKEWRQPKQSFETFLGTKSKGFFWRDYIEMPDLESGPKVRSMAEILADEAGGPL